MQPKNAYHILIIFFQLTVKETRLVIISDIPTLYKICAPKPEAHCDI